MPAVALGAHSARVCDLAVAGSGAWVVSVGRDGRAIFWQTSPLLRLQTVAAAGWLESAALRPCASEWVTGSISGVVALRRWLFSLWSCY